MQPNAELVLITRKIHNLKSEKKAFRTLCLILGALLICWLPFFVTLPVMSILKHHGFINDENAANTWFKIAFWLGYCNSAVSSFTNIDLFSYYFFLKA
jgi:adrenergic receptor alpha-1B